MQFPPMLYSLYNLVFSSIQSNPRGIDRIDLGLVSGLFEKWPAECYGLFPTALGLRLISRDQVLAGHRRLVDLWQEEHEAPIDQSFTDLCAAYTRNHPQASGYVGASPSRPLDYTRPLRLLLGDGIHIGKPLSKLPQGAIYVDVGHTGLANPLMHGWLRHRPDVKPVFMLHDAIPTEFPEFVSSNNIGVHRKIVTTAARYAATVIVPTKSAGRSVSDELKRITDRPIPIRPVGLPISDVFRVKHHEPAPLGAHPYFLVCGAIEARKNLLFLLNIWRGLVTSMGNTAPRLILAGSPGYASSDVMEQIRRSNLLKNHVFVASGMSSVSIARLMVGARALLMPSFAEGFGLPPAEALALGTPAILSDIDAHREAVGEHGIFIDPTDGIAWTRWIRALTEHTDTSVDARARAADFLAKDWPTYVSAIENILTGLQQ